MARSRAMSSTRWRVSRTADRAERMRHRRADLGDGEWNPPWGSGSSWRNGAPVTGWWPPGRRRGRVVACPGADTTRGLGGLPARLAGRPPGPGIVGTLGLPADRRHPVAPAGQGRAATGGQSAPGRAGRYRHATARAVPRGHAVIPAVLYGGLPAAGDAAGADRVRDVCGRAGADRADAPAGRPWRDLRLA